MKWKSWPILSNRQIVLTHLLFRPFTHFPFSVFSSNVRQSLANSDLSWHHLSIVILNFPTASFYLNVAVLEKTITSNYNFMVRVHIFISQVNRIKIWWRQFLRIRKFSISKLNWIINLFSDFKYFQCVYIVFIWLKEILQRKKKWKQLNHALNVAIN